MNRFFLFLVISMSSSLFSQNDHIKTDIKLVVGIVVDQMKYEYIPRYWDKYSEGGFKRLVNGGFLAKNAHYSYYQTSTAPGHATIVTGTSPSYHRIVGNSWFDRKLDKNIYCVDDDRFNPIGTKSNIGKKSPKNLQSTTISDENRIFTNFKGKTISVSFKDRSAVLSGGHTANGVYWFHSSNEGVFVSSSYYFNKLPDWVEKFNNSRKVDEYIKTWDTLYKIKSYTESGSDLNNYEGKFLGQNASFPYDLKTLSKKENGDTDYQAITTSPFGNTFLKDFALEALKNENLGEDKHIDFLHVNFSSPDHIGHKFGVNSKEVQDTYLRLDLDLKDLINNLDKKVGKGKYLIYLTSDHGATHVPKFLIDNKIPLKELDLRDSLRKKDWSNLIKAYSNNYVFLDKELIDKMEIDYEDAKELVKNGLKEIDGVYGVYDINDDDYMFGDGYYQSLIKNNSHPDLIGDLVVFLNPMYTARYNSMGSSHGTPAFYDTHVPIIFYGAGIKTGYSNDIINVKDIAPTIASIIGIGAPVSTTGKVISDAIK